MHRNTAPFLACLTTFFVGLTLACAPTDAAEDGVAGDTDTDTAGDTDTDTDTGAAESPFDCEDPEFTEYRPLIGPGYDPVMGLTGEPQATYVVHSTQLLIKPESIEEFMGLVQGINEQLEGTEGLLAFGFAGEPNCGFQRTLGLWRDTTSMYDFVLSGAHLEAMSHTTDISITGKVTHWEISADELPLGWAEAMVKLDAVPASALYD